MFESMFTKTYELPLAKTYVQHWGVKEAVREIIQNAIDSDSPFEWEFNEDELTITSRYSSLNPSTLLLGTTSKADNEEAIGNFGEGYKIAMLVLVREGKGVVIHNNGRDWTPSFKHSKQFESEVLSIEDTKSTQTSTGVQFVINGLSEEDIGEVKTSCLQMQEDVDVLYKTYYGDVLKDREGELYVNGLFVCKTEMSYGYNIKPEFLKLERDRQTVSGFDLKWLLKDLWFDTQEWEFIAKMIENKVEDVSYADYGTPELVKDACYKAFREKYPDAVVAKNQDELDSLVERGMTNVVIVDSASYIQSSSLYTNPTPVVVKSPTEVLTEWLSANRKEMRSKSIEAFRKELLKQAAKWKNV